ncbi:hypothetical protein [Novosphingopyxis baekryungensis]|uniref:hypothetical protein n=1 Tax=Novosphingopyxis baekryungensis TaxID=279369 RepID=UPI0003B385A1|nr:hypothetical protein [Novosphingopyxis baekryungensis]
MSSARTNGPFTQRMVVLGIAASLIAGLLFFVLASYAPNAVSKIGVTATPASNSAVGYSGFVQLMKAAGPETQLLSRQEDLARPGLLILFVDQTDDPDMVKEIAALRGEEPMLMVLPKWDVRPIGMNGNRVRSTGFAARSRLDALLQAVLPGDIERVSVDGPLSIAGVTVRAPQQLQRAPDAGYQLDGFPPGLLIEAEDFPHLVLTDPDFINNAGMDDIANARAMATMVDALRYTGDPLLIATPRLASGKGRNLGKLLLDPPFLPLTLILLFAGLLALLHGFVRFGPVAQRGRVFAFGKSALLDTTADLLSRAGKLPGLGPSYAETMRRRAAERLGAPPSLSGDKLEAWLDHRAAGPGDPQPLTTRLRAVENAQGEEELHRHARALAQWIKGQT